MSLIHYTVISTKLQYRVELKKGGRNVDTRLTYSVVCTQRKIKITLLILRIMSFGGGITSAVYHFYQSLDSMKLLTTADNIVYRRYYGCR